MSDGTLIARNFEDGNFLDRIRALELAVEELKRGSVKVTELSEFTEDLGIVTAGLFWSGDGLPGDGDETGTGISGEGETYGGEVYNLFGVNAGTLQFGGRQTDGKLYAGAGAVTLDEDGITILSVNTPAGINQIKFVTDDAYQTGYYESYFLGTTPNRSGIIQIGAERESGASGTGTSSIILLAHDGSATPSRLTITNDDSDPYLSFRDRWGNFGAVHWGDAAGYDEVVAASTTPTPAYTRTIEGGSLGDNGAFRVSGRLRVRNTGATSMSVTLDFIFGSTTLFTYTSTLTGATANRTVPIDFDFVLTNQNDDAINVASVFIADKIATAGGSTAVAANAFDGSGENRATEDTATDKTFTIQATLSTATNSVFEREFVLVDGPYHVT